MNRFRKYFLSLITFLLLALTATLLFSASRSGGDSGNHWYDRYPDEQYLSGTNLTWGEFRELVRNSPPGKVPFPENIKVDVDENGFALLDNIDETIAFFNITTTGLRNIFYNFGEFTGRNRINPHFEYVDPAASDGREGYYFSMAFVAAVPPNPAYTPQESMNSNGSKGYSIASSHFLNNQPRDWRGIDGSLGPGERLSPAERELWPGGLHNQNSPVLNPASANADAATIPQMATSTNVTTWPIVNGESTYPGPFFRDPEQYNSDNGFAFRNVPDIEDQFFGQQDAFWAFEDKRSGDENSKFPVGYPIGIKVLANATTYSLRAFEAMHIFQLVIINDTNQPETYTHIPAGGPVDYDEIWLGFVNSQGASRPDNASTGHGVDLTRNLVYFFNSDGGETIEEQNRDQHAYMGKMILSSPMGNHRNRLLSDLESRFFDPGNPAADDTLTFSVFHGWNFGQISFADLTNYAMVTHSPEILQQGVDANENQLVSWFRHTPGYGPGDDASLPPGGKAYDWVAEISADGYPLAPPYNESVPLDQFRDNGGQNFAIFGIGPLSMAAGDTVEMAFAVIGSEDRIDLFEDSDRLIRLWNSFLITPQVVPPPNIVAVDSVSQVGEITIYFDSRAEDFVDPFLVSQGLADLSENNLQRVDIFRSIDRGTSFGEVAQDPDGNSLGNAFVPLFTIFADEETGALETHSFTDDNVIPGVEYTYSLTTTSRGVVQRNGEFVFGAAAVAAGDVEISPVIVSGLGADPISPSVVRVTQPFSIASGISRPEITVPLTRVSGPTEVRVPDPTIEIIDPAQMLNAKFTLAFDSDSPIAQELGGLVYHVIVDQIDPPNDDLLLGDLPIAGDTLVTENEVLSFQSGGTPAAGIRITAFNDEAGNFDFDASVAKDLSVLELGSDTFGAQIPVTPIFGQLYEIRFFDTVVDTSQLIFGNTELADKPTKFSIWEVSEGKPERQIDFLFINCTDFGNNPVPDDFSCTENPDSTLSRFDEVWFVNEDVVDPFGIGMSWVFTFTGPTPSNNPENPGPGDVMPLLFKIGYSSDDQFTFSTKGPERVDSELTLADVAVVPNPYIVFTAAERAANQSEISFINLPPRATINIFTVSGQFVRTLVHEDALGDESWDLRSFEDIDVAYGLYVAVVETPDGDSRTLKLAIIR